MHLEAQALNYRTEPGNTGVAAGCEALEIRAAMFEPSQATHFLSRQIT